MYTHAFKHLAALLLVLAGLALLNFKCTQTIAQWAQVDRPPTVGKADVINKADATTKTTDIRDEDEAESRRHDFVFSDLAFSRLWQQPQHSLKLEPLPPQFKGWKINVRRNLKGQWGVYQTWQPDSPSVELEKILPLCKGHSLLIEVQARHAHGIQELAASVKKLYAESFTRLGGTHPNASQLNASHILWQVSHQGALKELRAQAPWAWYGLRQAELVKLNWLSALRLGALAFVRADFYIDKPGWPPATLDTMQRQGLHRVLVRDL